MASTYINLPKEQVQLASGNVTVDNFPVGSVPATDTVVMAVSGTEYTYTFPANLKWFEFRSSRRGTLSFGYATGDRNYQVMPGNTWQIKDISVASPLTIYISSTKNTDILELHYWV